MTTKYQYSPLSESPREIRILHIGPGVLNCHLEHVPLDTQPPPEYETISYCWGESTLSEQILVDGAKLPVPLNTWKALNRLAGEDGPRRLWIDAVCINQEDELERGHQVAVMRDVYSRGKQNLVYLGIEDQVFADKVIETFQMLDSELKEDEYFQEWLPHISEYFMDYTTHPIKSSFDEHIVSRFFSNPWFNRLWIFQETCLAKQSLCILGCSSSMDLDVILVVAYWLRYYHLHHISRHLQNHVGLRNARDTLGIQSLYQSSGNIPKDEALFTSQRLNALEAHDRVYALLGLMSKQMQKSQALKPDYSKPWQEVFRDATREALRDPSLNGYVLALISHRHVTDIHSQGLPSWVPDLRRKEDISIDPFRFVHSTRPGRARVSGSAEVLKLEGWMLGSVEFISDIAEFTNLSDNEKFLWFENVASIAQHGSDQRSDRVARTLMADLNWQMQLTTPADRHGYQVLLKDLKHEMRFPTRREFNSGSESAQAAQFWQAFINASYNRKFAITKDKRFLLVPQITEPSDTVVDVGFEYHLVLRKVRKGFSTRYIFLGQCYVDGCMRWQDGYDEHVAKLKKKNFKII